MFFKAMQISKKENIERKLVKKRKGDDKEKFEKDGMNTLNRMEESIKGSEKTIATPDKYLDNMIPSKNDEFEAPEMQNDFMSNSMDLAKVAIIEKPDRTSTMLKRQICNFFLLISSYCFVLAIALLRGGEGKESIIGLDKCSEGSWLLL